MHPAATSKEEILKTSRELIRRNGWTVFNVRSIAAACGVSVGAVYNYFDSKAGLMAAVVESIWQEIFHRPADQDAFRDIQDCVRWIYERMEYGSRQYPGFFTLHSVAFMQEDRPGGKRRMQQAWRHILEELCAVLRRDGGIRAGAFTEQLTVEKFADVLFAMLLSALLRQDYDPSAALEVVRRTLY